MKLNANEKLDKVLRNLYGKLMSLDIDEIAELTKSNLNVKDLRELQAILDKLVKDGMVKCTMVKHINFGSNISFDKNVYEITFEGQLFIENDGYNKKSKEYELQKDRVRLQHNFNLILALSSIGTMIVMCADYFKKDEVYVLQNQSIEVKVDKVSAKKLDTCIVYRTHPKQR
ncbi:hypothetical protein [Sediminibacterium sp.]|uniref:hypothetical protein n=1 Tax=Sediminibacterium sp. TaxID=1917865 RepID=UPI0025CDCEA6|nr:hypothetical protein [Sediminibacterium sp.]MBT9485065.1 hypothetical protein [Sediminibacterium sp.]